MIGHNCETCDQTANCEAHQFEVQANKAYVAGGVPALIELTAQKFPKGIPETMTMIEACVTVICTWPELLTKYKEGVNAEAAKSGSKDLTGFLPGFWSEVGAKAGHHIMKRAMVLATATSRSLGLEVETVRDERDLPRKSQDGIKPVTHPPSGRIH